ncbi:hypothetical protein BKA70DRAFT_198185 [Coprinopsis sp. MPI-PUGE-AT-0042]|nr:hypothetical protein BKA70DRAFT_198185 [Coprinopsis sp. MPI-PUGE-AT-0042]
MTDTKVNISTNKLAMSRALGAAFLNHKVEQLEKTVTGTGSGNWRDRRTPQTHGSSPNGVIRRGPTTHGAKGAPRKTGEPTMATPTRGAHHQHRGATTSPPHRRRSEEEDKKEKDADIIVVDASVLVHALYKVKKWARDGREEIVIVPLEALNTLDLLKKGNSALAQRARAASRILEAQVGTNSRIRVQRDDAYVLWDKIPVKEEPDSKASSCPEWVRRVICCAQWESEHAKAGLKVILAVLGSAPTISPQTAVRGLDHDVTLNPVPLPAPNPHHNKHEPRSAGALVSSWATRAGVELLEVEPTLPGRGGAEDDDRGKRPCRARGLSGDKASLVERPPAVKVMMEMCAQPSKTVRLLARGEKLDPDS